MVATNSDTSKFLYKQERCCGCLTSLHMQSSYHFFTIQIPLFSVLFVARHN